MDITKVDDRNFKTEEVSTTSYSIDDMQGQIDTLQKRVAQIISNYQDNIKAAIQPALSQIETLKALLADASSAGLDTTEANPIADTTAVVAALDTIKADAEKIAVPAGDVLADPTP